MVRASAYVKTHPSASRKASLARAGAAAATRTPSTLYSHKQAMLGYGVIAVEIVERIFGQRPGEAYN